MTTYHTMGIKTNLAGSFFFSHKNVDTSVIGWGKSFFFSTWNMLPLFFCLFKVAREKQVIFPNEAAP